MLDGEIYLHNMTIQFPCFFCRFTKDTESMDVELTEVFTWTIGCLVASFFSLFVVSALTRGINVAFILVLGIVYVRIQRRYLASSRELKRLDSLALSPIFGHFNESLSGLQTVRAFGKQREFIAKNEVGDLEACSGD